MTPLTERQAKIVDVIRRITAETRRPPTFRDLMREFGFRSPNAVASHLDALERKGAIRPRQHATSRDIVLTPDHAGPWVRPRDGGIELHCPPSLTTDEARKLVRELLAALVAAK